MESQGFFVSVCRSTFDCLPPSGGHNTDFTNRYYSNKEQGLAEAAQYAASWHDQLSAQGISDRIYPWLLVVRVSCAGTGVIVDVVFKPGSATPFRPPTLEDIGRKKYAALNAIQDLRNIAGDLNDQSGYTATFTAEECVHSTYESLQAAFWRRARAAWGDGGSSGSTMGRSVRWE